MRNHIQVISLVTLKIALVHSVFCGNQYVSRGHLCCRPTFNCAPGHYIAPCTRMYQEERCQVCPEGHVQPDHINSLDRSRDCFIKQRECTSTDLTYSKPRENCYPRHCKCRTDNCFIDDHCVCVKVPECIANQTLNPKTGDCEPCPKFSYKHSRGCGPCITDVEAWRKHQGVLDSKENRQQDSVPNADCQLKHKAAERKIAQLRRKIRKLKRKSKKSKGGRKPRKHGKRNLFERVKTISLRNNHTIVIN